MIIRLCICVYVAFSALPAVAERPVTVFAAASLSTVLGDIVAAWEGPVSVSYGGSGLLARQVALGAPADLVLLANPQWMDWLVQNSAIISDTRQDLLANRLVLIGPAGAPQIPNPTLDKILKILGNGRLAIGQTDSVPAGQYARAYLQNTGLWTGVQHALAEAENVRVALSYVARGETPLGIVYATDAKAEQQVTAIFDIPPDSHPAIRYPLALTTTAQNSATDFLNFLLSAKASAIFDAHGFTPLQAAQ